MSPPPEPPPAGEEASDWLSQRERGTVLGIRLAFWLATVFGRRPLRLFVCALALWYRLRDRTAVAASRDWLTRVHGRSPGFWEIYRHLRTFTQVTLDRVFLLTGKTRGLTFTHTGAELLEDQIASGRGAVLLGAHLGSYDAMRSSGAPESARVQILGYFENARMINALFERLDPEKAARVIHLGSDPVGVMTRVRARLDEGDLVALLGDRVMQNDRAVPATFFGEPADFAAGPFLLASVLHCPIFLVFGLYTEPGRYDLYCESFADALDIPRAGRQQVLQEWVQRYARRLEDYCRRAPDNWFNFYDFWKTSWAR